MAIGMFGENFPYTNFHNINLDWIIKTVLQMDSKLDSAVAGKIAIADPLQWDITRQYEAYTVVMDNDNAYLSMQPVPYGVAITNEEYWQRIFDLSEIFDNLKQAISFSDDGESTTSSANRSVNDLVWLNDTLHKVIAPITLGDTYSSSNVQEISVETWVKALISGYDAEFTALETDIQSVRNLYKRNRKSVILIGDSYAIDTDWWNGWIHAFDDEYGAVIVTRGKGFGGSGFKYGNDDIPNFNTLLTEVLETMTETQKNNVTDIIAVGGYNDMSRSASVSELKNYMTEFKTTALTACPYAKVSVGFCGVHYSNNSAMTACRIMNTRYTEAGNKAGVAVIKNLILTLLNKSLLFTTAGNENRNFHPNTDGNKQLAMRICNYILTGNIGRVTYSELTLSNKYNVYVEDGIVTIVTAGTAPFMPSINGKLLYAGQWVDIVSLEDSNLLWFFSLDQNVTPTLMCLTSKTGQITDFTERIFYMRFRGNKIQVGNILYGYDYTVPNDVAMTLPTAISLPWEAVY